MPFFAWRQSIKKKNFIIGNKNKNAIILRSQLINEKMGGVLWYEIYIYIYFLKPPRMAIKETLWGRLIHLLVDKTTVNTIQGKTLENILQGQNFHIITLAKILLKLPGSSQDWKLRTALKPASFNDKNLHRPKKCSTSSKVLMRIILYNSRILFACVFSFLILFKRFFSSFPSILSKSGCKVFLLPSSSFPGLHVTKHPCEN